MAFKKGGLGKNLDILFAENSTEDAAKTVTLHLTEVAPNPDQPRRQFDEAALAELSASVEKYGILQPLLVRPMADGSYQIVAGERRWRAARMAGLTEVPVVIRELSDRETAELALIENLQREDLNPMEEARGYQTLMEQFGLTQEDAAAAVNKSRPAITNALRLLKLPKAVMTMVEDGALSAGHARALLTVTDAAQQLQLAKDAAEKGLSVRAVEAAAKAAKAPKPHKAPFKASFYDEVALSVSGEMKRKVKVHKAKKGGTIQIEFFDDDDLRSLAKTLTGEKG